jgi:hypothetical protein
VTADEIDVTDHFVRARHADFVECACGQLCVNGADHDEHVFQVKVERARMRRRRLASFESGLRYHLANGPDTWTVRKKADKLWHVVNASRDCVVSARTKQQATALLTGGAYWRIWHEHDAWYRGTSRDPRNRTFTEEEQEVIKRVLAAHDSEQVPQIVPQIGPDRWDCGCSLSEHLRPPNNGLAVIGRCQHCGVEQFDNPNADPALDSMAHLCWKCVRPWQHTEPRSTVQRMSRLRLHN